MGLSCMSLNKRIGPLSAREIKEQKKLFISLKERIRQLRMAEYIDDDEEPEIFF